MLHITMANSIQYMQVDNPGSVTTTFAHSTVHLANVKTKKQITDTAVTCQSCKILPQKEYTQLWRILAPSRYTYWLEFYIFSLSFR